MRRRRMMESTNVVSVAIILPGFIGYYRLEKLLLSTRFNVSACHDIISSRTVPEVPRTEVSPYLGTVPPYRQHACVHFTLLFFRGGTASSSQKIRRRTHKSSVNERSGDRNTLNSVPHHVEEGNQYRLLRDGYHVRRGCDHVRVLDSRNRLSKVGPLTNVTLEVLTTIP